MKEKRPQSLSVPQTESSEPKPQLVEHVRIVTSLIEGRRVSLAEIFLMLGKKRRQHSIGRRRRIEYIVWQLKNDPP